MASLTDVYEGHVRTVTTSRRVSLGASTFVVGVAMVVGSIAIATTGVGAQFGFELYEARRLAGILAGLGIPAAFLGVFTVLPASRAARATALIGASLTAFGVTLFSAAYPRHWFDAGGSAMAIGSLVAYFAGAMVTLVCLFAALATFKTRNEPGGTAKMRLTEEGSVRLIEDADAAPGLGGVGLFGTEPDGEAATQTNRDSPHGGEGTTVTDDAAEVLTENRSQSRPTERAAATADGGSATVDDRSASTSQNGRDGHDNQDPSFDDAEFLDAAAERGRPDAYCGNCAHFEYVKVDGEIEPFCGYSQELMDDMDACRQWEERE